MRALTNPVSLACIFLHRDAWRLKCASDIRPDVIFNSVWTRSDEGTSVAAACLKFLTGSTFSPCERRNLQTDFS